MIEIILLKKDPVPVIGRGAIPGVYATVDFGAFTNVTQAFEAQRQYSPEGPLVSFN